MKIAAIFIFAAALSGCAVPQKTTYLRLDGKSISSDPLLGQQFKTDFAICNGELQKAWLTGGDAGPYRNAAAEGVGFGCMAGHGYRIEQKPAY